MAELGSKLFEWLGAATCLSSTAIVVVVVITLAIVGAAHLRRSFDEHGGSDKWQP